MNTYCWSRFFTATTPLHNKYCYRNTQSSKNGHSGHVRMIIYQSFSSGRHIQRCLPAPVYCVAQRKIRRCILRRCRWRQVRKCPVIVCMATRSGSCPGFWTCCGHSDMTSSCDSYTPGRMTCTQSTGWSNANVRVLSLVLETISLYHWRHQLEHLLR